jgi:Right handed beta helix region
VPDLAAFEVAQEATGTRFNYINFVGYSDGTIYPERGGIGLDVRAGRAVIDNCFFSSWRVALFLRSFSDDGTEKTIGNADGFMVRDCEFTTSIYGLWALGLDAQTGTVMNCRFTNCRKGITEQSAFGNHYISNYVISCPNSGDPKASEGYGIWIASDSIFATAPNSSTFTSNWLESGEKAKVNSGCAVLGGNMPGFVRQGDRVGLGSCALVFRGGCNNPDDFVYIGGDAPSVMRPAPNGAIAFFQRNSDVYSYKSFSYCSADPAKPDPDCGTLDEQGWKLRDGSTTYPCKD